MKLTRGRQSAGSFRKRRHSLSSICLLMPKKWQCAEPDEEISEEEQEERAGLQAKARRSLDRPPFRSGSGIQAGVG
jgi:hypothetical protein